MSESSTPSTSTTPEQSSTAPDPTPKRGKKAAQPTIWDRFPELKPSLESGSVRNLYVVGNNDLYEQIVDAIEHDEAMAAMPNTGKVKEMSGGHAIYDIAGARLSFEEKPNVSSTGTGPLKGITSPGLWMVNKTGGTKYFEEVTPQ